MAVHELPKGVIKLISSSQIISSISSVVKELVENSIDAGASVIDIKLERNGLDKIEVRDNGYGINTTDIYKVCLPNYTSKIYSFEDLENLQSYGFRGEALNSLCAVSHVCITTKTTSDEVASTYTYDNNGTVRDVQLSHQMKGTIVTVTDLFRNIPVRKQFFENTRKATEELKKLEKIVKLLSVIHPKLRVTIANNKCLIWQKTSVNSLRLSLMQVYPNVVLKNLVDFSTSYNEMNLEMLICKRDCNWSVLCQSANEAILFYVNQRPVKDKKVEKVVMEEMTHLFASTLPSNKCPLTLISIKLPSQNLDVNLEPDKTRVFIKNHEEVLKQIRESIMLHFYEQPLHNEKHETEAALSDITNEGTIKRRKIDIRNTQNIENELQDEDRTNLTQNSFSCRQFRNEISDLDTSFFDENLDINESCNLNNILNNEKTLSIISDTCLDLENSTNFGNTVHNNSTVPGENNIETSTNVGGHQNTKRTSNNDHEPAVIDEKIITDYENSELCFLEKINKSSMKEFNSNFESLNESSNDDNIENMMETGSKFNGEYSECNLNIDKHDNQPTLSQFSKGNIKIGNQRLEGSTHIFTGKKEEFSNNKIEEIFNVEKKQSTKLDKKISNDNILERSVSSQMGRKDMAGLTNFTRTVRSEIIKDNPGISFAKVASELANRWRNLKEDQKNMYAEKAKSSKNPKNLSLDVKTRSLIKKKIILVNVCLEDVTKHLKNARNLSSKNDIRVICSLQTKNEWLCRINDAIVALNVPCLQENVLFHRYLCHSSIPLRQLDKPIEIMEETIGNELQTFLLSLEKSQSNGGSYSVISDCRIVKNGFKLIFMKGLNGKEEIFITEATNEPSFNILENFIETLRLAQHHDDVLHCRPSLIKQILRDKVTETRRDISNFTDIDISMLLEYWIQTMSQKQICSYEQHVCAKLYDL